MCSGGSFGPHRMALVALLFEVFFFGTAIAGGSLPNSRDLLQEPTVKSLVFAERSSGVSPEQPTQTDQVFPHPNRF